MPEAVDVLILEDDPAYCDIFQAAMGSIGWNCRVFHRAAHALAAVSDRRPSLIVTDVDLPDMNGYEFCRRIREDPKARDIPVLMVTGTFRRDEDKLRGLGSGANAYLLKPFHVPELLATAQGLVRKSSAP